MSLFWSRQERRSSDWTDMASPAGQRRVTPESATSLAPVFAAIRHLVDFTSSLPADAYRVGSDKKRVEIPLPRLLASQDELGRPGLDQWIGQFVYGIATRGNAVGWVVEHEMGRPTVVSWLPGDAWGFDEYTKQWTVNGQMAPASSIFHVPWIVPPGKTLGLSPIECYAAIVRAGLSAQDYADVQRGGGIPPAVLKNSSMTLTPDEAETVQSRAVRSFSTGKPFVTGADWDLSLLTIPPNHAQFIETLKLSANQVAAIYGIDPREIGGSASESLTYSTDESRSLNRANNARPYIVRLERAVNRVLLPGEFVKLNVDATIRTDIKTRTDVVGAQLADGRMSVNEARALEDRQPVQGGDSFAIGQDKAQRDVAETLQKIYLAVGTVITTDEARELANAAGAGLSLPGPSFAPKPAAPIGASGQRESQKEGAPS